MSKTFVLVTMVFTALMLVGGLWNSINPPWWVDGILLSVIFVYAYGGILKMLEE